MPGPARVVGIVLQVSQVALEGSYPVCVCVKLAWWRSRRGVVGRLVCVECVECGARRRARSTHARAEEYTRALQTLLIQYQGVGWRYDKIRKLERDLHVVVPVTLSLPIHFLFPSIKPSSLFFKLPIVCALTIVKGDKQCRIQTW